MEAAASGPCYFPSVDPLLFACVRNHQRFASSSAGKPYTIPLRAAATQARLIAS